MRKRNIQQLRGYKVKLLREYIRELLLEQTESGKGNQEKDMSVGYVLDSIKAFKEIEEEQDSKKKAQKEKDYLEKRLWQGAKLFSGMFPGGSATVKLVKFIRDATKKNIPDAQSSKDPILDALDIDDRYTEILDDDLELRFIEAVLKELEGLDRDSMIPDMDKELEKFVRSEHQTSLGKSQ